MVKYAYDITLDGKHVGDSGDMWFDTFEEAQVDSDNYIISCLKEEYKRPYLDFVCEIGGYDLDDEEDEVTV